MKLPILETPKYRTTLHSNGKTVEYRPFLVKEEKILLMALESKDVNQMIDALYDIIDACTFNTLDVKKLPTYDMEQLFVLIRQKSVGEKQVVKVTCPECQATNEFELDFEKVRLTEQGKVSSKIRINDNVVVEMKHPTMYDVYGVMSKVDGSMAEQSYKVAAASIKAVYYGEDVFDDTNTTKEELEEFIGSMNSEQFRQMQEYIGSVPRIELDLEYTCMNCGYHEEDVIRGLQSFFI